MDTLAQKEKWPVGWAFDDQHTLVFPAYGLLPQEESEFQVR